MLTELLVLLCFCTCLEAPAKQLVKLMITLNNDEFQEKNGELFYCREWKK